MRSKLILIIAAIVVIIAAIIFLSVCFSWVNTDFAANAYVKYHYAGKTIDAEVTDADLEALKSILAGHSYREFGIPGCGFSLDSSIRLTDGKKIITFCPACDGCNIIRIGAGNRYIDISETKRKKLDAILAKYGMIFPCI